MKDDLHFTPPMVHSFIGALLGMIVFDNSVAILAGMIIGPLSVWIWKKLDI